MIVGLFVRHIKAYQKSTFIPIGDCNFASYIGKNGIGKSSILEALNSFLNGELYSINKYSSGTNLETNFPFIAPVFLIEKNKIKTNFEKKQAEHEMAFYEELSTYLWNIQEKDCSNIVNNHLFFEIREQLKSQKDDNFFFTIGERLDNNRLLPTFSFLSNPPIKIDPKNKDELKLFSRRLQFIKNLYSLIYIPIEISAENFTKLETNEMQKIVGTSLKEEIRAILADVKIRKINDSLKAFLGQIEHKLSKKYHYDTGNERYNTITENDLIAKIIESYFQKRFLFRDKRKISELSAGEKRQALIDIINAFLEEESRELYTIIALDEPEASLHTSLCYEQFEKLYKIAHSSQTQVLITTHWYGFLPILGQGFGHFLSEESNEKKEIKIESYNLLDYRSKIKQCKKESKGELPTDLTLKSRNDLVQSIYHSLFAEIPYNWLIVEGLTEKFYFEYFFNDEIKNKNLKILPLGENSEVLAIYKYLDLALQDLQKKCSGKIFCLIDTDNKRLGGSNSIGNSTNNDIIRIRRFGVDQAMKNILLLRLDSDQTDQVDIEQSLDANIFEKTLHKLDSQIQLNIQNYQAPTLFHENLRCFDLKDFFSKNNGENKIAFAKEYIKTLEEEKKEGRDSSLDWIEEIRKFFS